VKDSDIVTIARVAHEANRAWCAANGDISQPPWEGAPLWQQRSAIDGVEFRIKNPDATPATSHVNWCAMKFREGWRWGPVKDPERKEHPCLMPYSQLSQVQRVKDVLFIAIVQALHGHSGGTRCYTRMCQMSSRL